MILRPYFFDEQYNQMTVLHQMCMEGNTEMAQTLIDLGAEVNKADAFGATALHYAARAGHFECVKLLIQNQADVNALDKKNETAQDKCAAWEHDFFIATDI